MKKIFFILFLLVPLQAFGADFNFYGLEFGMKKEAVKNFFPEAKWLSGSSGDVEKVEYPKHGMMGLILRYNEQGQLYQIITSYSYNTDEEKAALMSALMDRFVKPNKGLKDISIDLTETERSSSQYFVLTLTSKPLREAYIETLKKERLKKME